MTRQASTSCSRSLGNDRMAWRKPSGCWAATLHRLWNIYGTNIVLLLPIRHQHRNKAIQHDGALRDAARAIYESVYPGDDWTLVPFDEAERFGTVHYRNAVDAARWAHACLHGDGNLQLMLI